MSNTPNDSLPDANEDLRQHPRFNLRAYAELQYSSKKWEAHVLDISAQGARLALLGEHLLCKGDALRVHISVDTLHLHPNKKQLHLHGVLVHVREHIVGFKFQPDAPLDKEVLELLLAQIATPE
jgi:hypothetical protein